MDVGKVFSVIGFLAIAIQAAEGRAQMRGVPVRTCQNAVADRAVGGVEARGGSRPNNSEGGSVERKENAPETLRAFESARRLEGIDVGVLVGGLLFGVVGAILIFFILYAVFYEPPEANRPYKPTEVRRGENFTPYRHSRQSDRDDIDA